MLFRYILYFIFLTLFACEHHSSNINIKNKPDEIKSVVKKKEIKNISEKKEKIEIIENKDIINIVYSNKGFALIYDQDKYNLSESKLDNSTINILSPNLPNGTPVRITNIINGKKIIK